MKASPTVLALWAAVASAAGIPFHKRADSCGQWDTTQVGNFKLYNNMWGKDSGSGSQCVGLGSGSSGSIAWHSTWSWSGGDGKVKSYLNVEARTELQQLRPPEPTFRNPRMGKGNGATPPALRIHTGRT
ncbi:hypothetical protein BBP40_000635 [Aspergillus hancockii]|nr:hypothetical protein BBP40_000635 [Aspergillus hancockii]